MTIRDFISIVEDINTRSFEDEATEAASRHGVSAEFVSVDPDGAEWDYVRYLPVDLATAVLINSFEASKPRTGQGRSAMVAITRIADQSGIDLVLEPWAGTRTSQDMLVRWYGEFGFKLADNGWMYRKASNLAESVGGAGTIPRFTLKAGTIIYHGTETRANIEKPRGPAWFTRSLVNAQKWAGWRTSDPDKGIRRVLAYRVTSDIELYDTRKAQNYYKVAALFDPENEPEDASPWTVAENLKGSGGWYGRDEVMLTDVSKLELMKSEPVPKTVKSYGDASR
jgi:hypothetical protein